MLLNRSYIMHYIEHQDLHMRGLYNDDKFSMIPLRLELDTLGSSSSSGGGGGGTIHHIHDQQEVKRLNQERSYLLQR